MIDIQNNGLFIKLTAIIRIFKEGCADKVCAAIVFLQKMKIPLMLAFVHFFVTTVFQLDKAFFVYERDTRCYYCIKFLYLIALLTAWCFAWHICRQFRDGDERVRRGIFIFGFYLFLMLALLLILWPGTWAWDDIFMVNTIRYYRLPAWQHIITAAVQMVFLNFIPCPGGIIIVQNIIIAACVAFSVTELEEHFLGGLRLRWKFLDVLVKVLPFLLPGVLTYQFSGYRYGLYIYCVLVFMVILVSARNGRRWTLLGVMLYAFIAAVISEWRTESMFFLPVSCVLLVVQKRPLCSARRKIIGIVCILSCFFTLDYVQKKKLGNSNYEIISTLRPLCELVRHADESDAKELEELDKVVFVQKILDSKDNGEALYWRGDVVRNGYSKEDYAAYLKAFFILALRHPKIVAKERIKIFIQTSNFTGKTAVTNVGGTSWLENFKNDSHAGKKQFGNYTHNQPIFNKARKFILKIWVNPHTYRIVWNPIIPMCFLFAAWIYCLAKRRWYFFLLLSGEAVRVILSFLTAPAHWFMYYLPEYLLGWTLFLYAILCFLAKKCRAVYGTYQ